MTVWAHLRAGGTVELAPELGATPEQIVLSLTSGSFTGSAVPLADAWVKTADGGMIRYSDVTHLAPGPGQ